MCGIFAYTGIDINGAQIVLDGLKSLEYRGYDSWGIAVMNENKASFRIKKKVGKIGNATIKGLPLMSAFGFGHTRWATHGGVTVNNAHPLADCTGKVVVIHNGIIENYEKIKQELVKKGHRFTSETDTEVAVHLIEELKKRYSFQVSVQRAFERFEGLNALIVADVASQTFIAVRNGSPLVIGFGKDSNFLSSDAAALLQHTRKVYFLQDHDFVEVTKSNVKARNLKTGRTLRIKPLKLNWEFKQAEKGRFHHFMLKEIMEQPTILENISSTGLSGAKQLAAVIKNAREIHIVGCGTAAYASIAGSYLFSKIAKQQMSWDVGSEFNYKLEFLSPKSLVIALSQSGETIDTLEAVKKAKQKGVKIAALVNVLGSTLYRGADLKILIGAGPEKAVASTKAFTSKIGHLILTAFAQSGKEQEGQYILRRAAKASKTVLRGQSIKNIRKLVLKIKNVNHIYVIGRGLSYPASLETALKIKEISYIHAEGFAAGELKHGVIALVEEGTPCIVFAPNDETYGANLAGAMEMKARGGMIIGISHIPHSVFDHYIPVQDAKQATIIPNVIVAQLLAYELALARGLDPDMPRNLAKSVTVK